MTDIKERLVRFLYEHQEDALTNYDRKAREECRCGKQGDQFWRPHLADALMAEFGIGESEDIAARMRAFGRDCLEHGDMTPSGKRMLDSIAERYENHS